VESFDQVTKADDATFRKFEEHVFNSFNEKFS